MLTTAGRLVALLQEKKLKETRVPSCKTVLFYYVMNQSQSYESIANQTKNIPRRPFRQGKQGLRSSL
jgi:hypothetical protein